MNNNFDRQRRIQRLRENRNAAFRVMDAVGSKSRGVEGAMIRNAVRRIALASPKSFGSMRDGRRIANEAMARSVFPKHIQRQIERYNSNDDAYESAAQIVRGMRGSGRNLDAIIQNNGTHFVPLIKAIDDLASYDYNSIPNGNVLNPTKFIDALLKAGVDINVRDVHGRTPLMAAIEYKFKGLVRRLLDLGADVNIGIRDGGWTALSVAVMRYPDIVPELLRRGANVKRTAINAFRVVSIPIKLLKFLIDRGLDVNKRRHPSTTLLHKAAEFGAPKHAAMLLVAGASTRARDDKGRTPLMVAVKKQDNWGLPALKLKTVRLLLRVSPLGAEDSEKKTALMHAIEAGDPNIIRLLVAAGAPVRHAERRMIPRNRANITEAFVNGRRERSTQQRREQRKRKRNAAVTSAR